MSSGFLFEERKTPQFPDRQEWVNVTEFNRQHQVGKRTEPENLSELDKLRERATKGKLW